MTTVRVATTQYRTGNDIAANLEKLLGFIAAAARGGAQLIVAPEFGNHTSFYTSQEQAWEVAVDLEGPYLEAVQGAAREHGIHVVFNATRRGDNYPRITITNFLVGPDGNLIGYDDKQVLMGGESEFLCGADRPGNVYHTSIGCIGMMSCLDGVPPETARNLALRGAQIITNGHNSCALDEPYAHIPARAAENGVWVVAAGKVGPVCVDEMLEPLAEQVGIPKHLITALGENPILDPQGVAVAQLPCLEEGIVFADIDVALASSKAHAGGDIFADRRPDLYGAVCRGSTIPGDGAEQPFKGAIVQVRSERPVNVNITRALDLVADAATNGASLVVLPELVIFAPGAVASDPTVAVTQSQQFEDLLGELCRDLAIHAVASVVREDRGFRHTGILINDHGAVTGHYYQTHLCNAYRDWCTAGSELPVWETDLGRISIMLGYDAVFPELPSVLARGGAEIIAHPTAWRFAWEPRLILPERAAENRVSILSAARTDSVIQRGGMINALSNSAPLRALDLNPIWPVEAPYDRECHISADIYPARSRNKDLLGFDLQLGRRHELYGIMAEPLAAEPAA